APTRSRRNSGSLARPGSSVLDPYRFGSVRFGSFNSIRGRGRARSTLGGLDTRRYLRFKASLSTFLNPPGAVNLDGSTAAVENPLISVVISINAPSDPAVGAGLDCAASCFGSSL